MVADDDTDSDGMDCLVANETLQFSTTDLTRRRSPEIRKMAKRAILAHGTKLKSGKVFGSFCARGAVP